MLLFTKYGFLSAVCARKGTGAPWEPVAPERIAIRFRTRQQLENVQRRFPDLLGGVPVWDDPHADYRYRLFVPKDVWVKLATALAQEIDYDRAKPAVIDFPGRDEYQHKLLEVWRVMLDSQENEGER
jgi:hypothetical protein